jgi:valyl-tRNA synthetase
VPLFGQTVPILADPQADPEKGTGVVMCCTFGDATDVAWWYTHRLPLVAAIDRAGQMTAAAGELGGLPLADARRTVLARLGEAGLILDEQPIRQSVRVHERCDTPVEYLEQPQWFVRVLDLKPELLARGDQVAWHPEHMGVRYRHWVENLSWDWCLSRQRYFGVPFPLWYCADCGEVVPARPEQLPVDPLVDRPLDPCPQCGGQAVEPEPDVFDTWATSSLTPQIAGRWLSEPALYTRVFPFTLRPQGHEIIRTWAFYTIVKSQLHFDSQPWQHVMISGWGLAAEGGQKISKSRGGGPATPLAMIQSYSADALRYWAASGGLGRDQVINEEKIAAGARLVTKLWNVARFSEPFLAGHAPAPAGAAPLERSPADAWLLARLQRLIARATVHFRAYDYAAAKTEIEAFFWSELADNYLEMAKLRLYNQGAPGPEPGARDTLYRALLALVKLFAPLLPYVTEEIYQGLFRAGDGAPSLHRAAWPQADPAWLDERVEAVGESLVAIAGAVRRYKSERSRPLGSPLAALCLSVADPAVAAALAGAARDLQSVTRAARVEVNGAGRGEAIGEHAGVAIAVLVDEPVGPPASGS